MAIMSNIICYSHTIRSIKMSQKWPSFTDDHGDDDDDNR